MRLIAFAALSLALTAPALADEPASTAAAVEAPAAASAPAAATSKTAQNRNTVVCRSTAEIGSLVKRHKTCLNKEQWKVVQEQNEAFARKMVEDTRSRTGGQ